MSSSSKIFDLESLVRPNILRLKPYRSARDDFKDGILLDANENPFESYTIDGEHPLNRYPDPHYDAVREALARWKKVRPSQIFLGNGSDEAIDLLIRMTCTPGKDSILITSPTYGMYKVSADIHDVNIIDVPLHPDFSLNTDEVIKASQNAKLVFLCSPNNPTANVLEKASILSILQQAPGIVVVDEAYMDFSPNNSLLSELDAWPNLVVMQTFSKAIGLAGIRLGMAFGSEEIIKILMKIKPPYNVNVLTQQEALRSLDNPSEIQLKIQEITENRKQLINDLSRISGVEHIFPSDANFLLVRFKDALETYKKLASAGVIVRYRGDQLHCDGCLRITVGTEDENKMLIEKLEAIYS